MTTVEPPAAKPGPSPALSILVFLVGVAVAVVGAATGIRDIISDVHGTRATTPATIQKFLAKGTWQVYLAQSEQTTGLKPRDVVVRAPEGTTVPTRGSGGVSETERFGSTTYVGEVQFTIPRSGTYQVRVDGTPGEKVALSQSLGQLARNTVKWFAVMGGGITTALTGAVLLIIGVIRRRNARHPATSLAGAGAYAGPPPPGWYPDPTARATSRWWDGSSWTEHTHPPRTP